MDPVEAAQSSARVAAVFDRVADTYDQVDVPWFTPIAERLVAGARPVAGERVLDIGCGRGAATFALAAAVGETGSVTGIDLSVGMIEATAADLAARGIANVDLLVMDASSPRFESGSFDLVTSSLVLFFLPDPAGALVAWRDLLVPGGRLAVSTFGSRTPEWEAIDDVFRPYLPPGMLDARTSGGAGPFANDAGVERLVVQAGFSEVRTEGAEIDVVLADLDHWYRWSRSHGQRAMWDLVPPDEHATVLAEVDARLASARDDDGRIRLRQRARFTYGRR